MMGNTLARWRRGLCGNICCRYLGTMMRKYSGSGRLHPGQCIDWLCNLGIVDRRLTGGSCMPLTLKVRDETTAGKTLHEFDLEFLTERISVRELIRSRVYQEVTEHNTRAAATVFCGLVQPTDTERELNGFKLREPRQID